MIQSFNDWWNAQGKALKGDRMAVALDAWSAAKQSVVQSEIASPLVAVDPGDLLEVLRVFANANWPDTKGGNAAFRIANALGDRWTQFKDGVLTESLHRRPHG